jgi:hypothetical protein
MIEKLRMRSIERRSMAVLACGLIAAAAGCGSNAGSPQDARQVRAVIAASDAAFFAGEWKKNCGFYTPAAQTNIVSFVPGAADNCPDAWRNLHGFLSVRLSSGQLDALRALTPQKVEIDGDHATATYGKLPPSLAGLPVGAPTVGLVRDNGRWLIDSVSLG